MRPGVSAIPGSGCGKCRRERRRTPDGLSGPAEAWGGPGAEWLVSAHPTSFAIARLLCIAGSFHAVLYVLQRAERTLGPRR